LAITGVATRRYSRSLQPLKAPTQEDEPGRAEAAGVSE
jgi:hypothetical protein